MTQTYNCNPSPLVSSCYPDLFQSPNPVDFYVKPILQGLVKT